MGFLEEAKTLSSRFHIEVDISIIYRVWTHSLHDSIDIPHRIQSSGQGSLMIQPEDIDSDPGSKHLAHILVSGKT